METVAGYTISHRKLVEAPKDSIAVSARRGQGAWIDIVVKARGTSLEYGYHTRERRWSYGRSAPDAILDAALADLEKLAPVAAGRSMPRGRMIDWRPFGSAANAAAELGLYNSSRGCRSVGWMGGCSEEDDF